MKKSSTTIWLIIMAVIVVLISGGIYWAFFDIQHIDADEIIEVSKSPDGAYTVTAYLNNGGATTDYSVLCSVTNNQTGKTRNIYWQYHCQTADIQWLDNTTVIINGIELDVTKDIYDYRRQ
jgi:hypothetical protein